MKSSPLEQPSKYRVSADRLRAQDEALWSFCAQQKIRFSRDAWIEFDQAPRIHVALAAAFLAMQDDFGNHLALIDVAESMHPGIMNTFPELIAKHRFDLSRFDHMLRAEIRDQSP